MCNLRPFKEGKKTHCTALFCRTQKKVQRKTKIINSLHKLSYVLKNLALRLKIFVLSSRHKQKKNLCF